MSSILALRRRGELPMSSPRNASPLVPCSPTRQRSPCAALESPSSPSPMGSPTSAPSSFTSSFYGGLSSDDSLNASSTSNTSFPSSILKQGEEEMVTIFVNITPEEDQQRYLAERKLEATCGARCTCHETPLTLPPVPTSLQSLESAPSKAPRFSKAKMPLTMHNLDCSWYHHAARRAGDDATSAAARVVVHTLPPHLKRHATAHTTIATVSSPYPRPLYFGETAQCSCVSADCFRQ